ncbi:hypothetical protein IWX92DRAFT_354915 [Phyllosticta citricarpa]
MSFSRRPSLPLCQRAAHFCDESLRPLNGWMMGGWVAAACLIGFGTRPTIWPTSTNAPAWRVQYVDAVLLVCISISSRRPAGRLGCSRGLETLSDSTSAWHFAFQARVDAGLLVSLIMRAAVARVRFDGLLAASPVDPGCHTVSAGCCRVSGRFFVVCVLYHIVDCRLLISMSASLEPAPSQVPTWVARRLAD